MAQQAYFSEGLSGLGAQLIVKAAAAALMCVAILGCSANKGTIVDRRGELFATPEAALEAVKQAFQAEDPDRLVQIFGEEGRDIIVSGDPVSDRVAMRRIATMLKERAELIPVEGNSFVEEQWYKLRFGIEGWDMRIPLVNRGDGWYVATHHAREAAQSTRIAINEVATMQTLVAIAAAQQQYMSSDHDGDGVKEYAQRIVSSDGNRDGLYWPGAPGVDVSPLDRRINEALAEGYVLNKEKGTSYEGFRYRVLKAQGKNAKGGKRSYLVGDNMTLGFAVLAYPTAWNKSGTNTYVIDMTGRMYKKDLGLGTEQTARSLNEHNPDSTWVLVDRSRYGEDVKIAPWLRNSK